MTTQTAIHEQTGIHESTDVYQTVIQAYNETDTHTKSDNLINSGERTYRAQQDKRPTDRNKTYFPIIFTCLHTNTNTYTHAHMLQAYMRTHIVTYIDTQMNAYIRVYS